MLPGLKIFFFYGTNLSGLEGYTKTPGFVPQPSSAGSIELIPP